MVQQQNVTQESVVDIERLSRYLSRLPDWRDALPITAVEPVGKGQSNPTFRVRLANGSVILRRPPPGPLPPKAHDVLREYRVLSGLVRSPVPVPRSLLACDDPSVLGAPFFLMEDLPGDAIRFQFPPALAADPDAPLSMSRQLVETLANLRTTDPVEVGLADLGRPTGYIARQLNTWNRQLDYARTRPVSDIDWTSEWLRQHLPPDVERPSIVHGDYKLDNAIFTLQPPPQLLGIVDWEMATLGDPLADLGWLLALWCQDGTPPPEVTILTRVTELPGFPRRAELAEWYAQRVGRELPDLRFYVVFALWKFYIVLEGHWARHVRGTAGGFDYTYLETASPILAAYIRSVAEGETFL
jgi:aminoglycoside phosphotransferase (APT) family kinase protein